VTYLKAIEERMRHQSDALDRLIKLAIEQSADRPLSVRLAVVAAAAVVAGVIVAIGGMILAA
jgi:hypothetical protein